MSLNWNLNKINDKKNVCFTEDGLKEVTNNLIWATLAVDIGDITEDNAEEFHHRLALLTALRGVNWNDISLQDIKNHVGLHTNVSTKTWKEFSTKVLENWCDDRDFNPKKKKVRS